jgi:hypothetical protein
MDVTIRPARPADIPRMCDLLADPFSVESDFEVEAVNKQVKGLSSPYQIRGGRRLSASPSRATTASTWPRSRRFFPRQSGAG